MGTTRAMLSSVYKTYKTQSTLWIKIKTEICCNYISASHWRFIKEWRDAPFIYRGTFAIVCNSATRWRCYTLLSSTAPLWQISITGGWKISFFFVFVFAFFLFSFVFCGGEGGGWLIENYSAQNIRSLLPWFGLLFRQQFWPSNIDSAMKSTELISDVVKTGCI